MASRKYKTFKFEYTSDKLDDFIKRQRAYYGADGEFLTPITNIFLSTVITDGVVADGSSANLRRLTSYVTNDEMDNGISEMTSILPFPPGDTRLIEHIREIYALNKVKCGDYRGEEITNLKSNPKRIT